MADLQESILGTVPEVSSQKRPAKSSDLPQKKSKTRSKKSWSYATQKVAHEGSSRVRDKTAFAWNVGQ